MPRKTKKKKKNTKKKKPTQPIFVPLSLASITMTNLFVFLEESSENVNSSLDFASSSFFFFVSIIRKVK